MTMTEDRAVPSEAGLEIAVIGMSVRLPGAENTHEFWKNLANGIESITFFSDEELERAGINRKSLDKPNYVKANYLLENFDYFDAGFFGYKPGEAQLMEPQVRLFHECAWEALEDAGYVPDNYKGKIGVYAGAVDNIMWRAKTILDDSINIDYVSLNILSDKDFLSLRLSYNLNLKGPSTTINTACSTALAAIHLACRGILAGECDMAIAGGVSISFPQNKGYLFKDGLLHSSDGHVRPFDARASGTLFGNGIALVILKASGEASDDGDHLYAVIKGSAMNNDGNRKVGFTAPSVKGQAEVIKMAHLASQVKAESISYIETHGTGTTLGDPIELKALKQAFKTDKRHFCAIGSVKSNVGHLNSAAGAAGFVKTVLALKHKQIPPSLHFENPNPEFDFHNSPFYVNVELTPWKRNGTLLRAGVSSFGFGGTNVHVVLEEAPTTVNYPQSSVIGGNKREWENQLILLSARSENALNRITENITGYFKANPGTNLEDAAYTLQVGRKAFEHRRLVVCSGIEEAVEALTSFHPEKVRSFYCESEPENNAVVFMFPGQGAQYVDMGRGLYSTEPVFRQEMDRCFDILKSVTDYKIKEILYSPTPCPMPHAIDQTEIAQPLLFVFEYSLAKLLMKWGIKPYAMIGHSIGEYVAACLSGVLSLEDALRFVVLRGRLMQQMPTGSMLSVSLPREELEPLLNEEVELAAVNGPSLCVVSGTHEAVNTFEKELAGKGIDSSRLHTSHAFHSRMMNPILKEIEEVAKQIKFNSPQIQYISNITGDSITFAEVSSPGYWSKHARQPVRFSEGIKQLIKDEAGIFLEIGPGRVLSTFVKKHATRDNTTNNIAINLVRHPTETVRDEVYLLDKIGELWLYGVDIDWQKFYHRKKPARIPLPTYPFEKHRFWIEGKGRPGNSGRGKKKDIDNWFYAPSWKRSVSHFNQPIVNKGKHPYLVFIENSEEGDRLVNRLIEQGHDVIGVKNGPGFVQVNDREYVIRAGEKDDYDTLLNKLQKLGKMPGKILYLWSISGPRCISLDLPHQHSSQESGFYSLLYLIQAVGTKGKQDDNGKIQIVVVTDYLQEVVGGESICPGKATLSGLIKVVAKEYDFIDCKSVDIDPEVSRFPDEHLMQQLLAEFSGDFKEKVVAYRRNHRWIQTFEPITLVSTEKKPERLKEKGVYLVTGGLGGIGLVLAEYLAKSVKARLILTKSSDFPAQRDWQQWLDNHEHTEKTSVVIRKLLELQDHGAEILVFSADTADHQQMQMVVNEAEKQFGPINGIIHSAGIADHAGIIHRRTQEMIEPVFKPKIEGVMVLDRILKTKKIKPDFFILCSSLSTILAPYGQVGYIAANAFLDAYAHFKTLDEGLFTVSINWDAWQEVGMAVDTAKLYWRNTDAPESKAMLDHGISPSEGIEVFKRTLDSPLPEIVVSTRDLKGLIKKESGFQPGTTPGVTSSGAKKETSQIKLFTRPKLSTEYVSPEDEIEQKLVEIWQDFLGIEKIGIYDNFFDLGATSLDIVRVNSIVNETFKTDIPVIIMFENPTVSSLARHLNLSLQDIDASALPPRTTTDRSPKVRKAKSLSQKQFQKRKAKRKRSES